MHITYIQPSLVFTVCTGLNDWWALRAMRVGMAPPLRYQLPG